jgi:prepilin-type N-terminal cleavage/methylation domain-containing protein
MNTIKSTIKITITTGAAKRDAHHPSRSASDSDLGRNRDRDRNRSRAPNAARNPNHQSRRGFTLVELLVVMIIIGIILSLVLVAAMDATNRANERATQALIAKLDAGMSDRLEALLQNLPMPTYTHGYIAAIYNSGTMVQPPDTLRLTDRAQVIAWYDYIKSELPDVFFIRNANPGQHDYPLSFTGIPFPGTAVDSLQYGHVILPLGQALAYNAPNSFGDAVISSLTQAWTAQTYPTLGLTGTGIWGASYAAAAGIYKNLGYLPLGFDGADNDGDGYIDNYQEGLIDPVTKAVNPQVPSPDNPAVMISVSQLISSHMANHTHNTARSEMLYALLVEGSGPWGSVFAREEFTPAEVQDTDKDGLPEFVDAWGQPLQFFRWPVYYHSDLQRGQLILPDLNNAQTWDLWPPYYDVSNNAYGTFRERDTNPLDRNQQLTAPCWWSVAGNGGGIAANNGVPGALIPANPNAILANIASGGVAIFQTLFHSLTEPYPAGASGGLFGTYWDRSGGPRRAFYTKFLILSGGQDQAPGVFLYSDAAMQSFQGANYAPAGAASFLIANENGAMQFGMDIFSGAGSAGSSANPNAGFATGGSATIGTSKFGATLSNDLTFPYSYDLQQAGQDDITNHNLQATGGIGGS